MWPNCRTACGRPASATLRGGLASTGFVQPHFFMLARKLRDLSLGVRPGVLRLRDQPVDRPALDLIRRPLVPTLARAHYARTRQWGSSEKQIEPLARSLAVSEVEMPRVFAPRTLALRAAQSATIASRSGTAAELL